MVLDTIQTKVKLLLVVVVGLAKDGPKVHKLKVASFLNNILIIFSVQLEKNGGCLLYTSPSPRDS